MAREAPGRHFFTGSARDDLIELYDYIAAAAGARMAISYIERLEIHCLGFDMASELGHRRDDVRPDLRIVGFERQITIAFMVDDARVTILRFFPKGRNWQDAF